MIPSNFRIGGGKLIKVEIEDVIPDGEEDTKFGEFNSGSNVISIAKRVVIDGESYDQTEEDMERTFLHELGHTFQFYSGMEMDEMVAQSFSNFMYEYLHTNGKS